MQPKVIQIFENGVGVIDPNSKNVVVIDGSDPIEELPATEENLKEYFTEEELEPLVEGPK